MLDNFLRGRMRKLVTVLVFSVFLLSSFQTVGAGSFTQEVHQACSNRAIVTYQSQPNANITELTTLLEKNNSQLDGLYLEWNATRNIDILFEIVELKDEIRLLTNKLKYLERQKLSLQLLQNYTVETPYGRKVLSYKLPPESAIVQEYIKKVHPVRTDVDLAWFVSYYRQAAELTFTQIAQTDMGMRDRLKEVKTGNYTDETISEILTLLGKRQKLWREFYKFAEEKEKLQTLQTLKEVGRKQTLIATAIGVKSLPIHFGGISSGCLCPFLTCYNSYGIAPALPGASHPLDASSAPYVYYREFYPVAVWVGMYTSEGPDVHHFWGDYCTYEFPSTGTDFKKYWDRATRLGLQKSGSIQVKLFYEGDAYNPKVSSYQESNIIWQVECNKSGCWVVTDYLKPLPDPDVTHYYEDYKLYVNANWLTCCGCGGRWKHLQMGEQHCGGCFAQDASKSQNFVVCTRDGYGNQCGWDWVVKW